MNGELIETLRRYVPGLVIRRLAADPSPIKEPSAERLAAAVLFVDITDFTALADRLAHQDLIESEHLALLLNDCFGRLIRVIHAHGGEVTKFAGDALLALWPVPSHLARLGPEAQLSLSEMASRSAQCALKIQEEMADFTAADGSPVALQIGIGAGDVYNVHLGGVFNRWEFLLSGTPLVQMSLAKELAPPGGIVFAPEVWKLVQSRSVGKPLTGGFVELVSISSELPLQPMTLPDLDEPALKNLQVYLPAAVLKRLEAGHEPWLSELRRVSVMFVKLPRYGTSIKHPYMRTIPEAQAVMRALQEALYRYAGSINKFNVDDKGITLVAALGLPPLSHSDDAARAVRAALEMQVELEKLGRESAIGITTGWVYCGPIGNDERREYTMVGYTVNMAARLMQEAEKNLATRKAMSDILIDDATYREINELRQDHRSLSHTLDFDVLPLTQIKGVLEPISIHRPSLGRNRSASTNRETQAAAIIGMNEERSYLESSLFKLNRSKSAEAGQLIIVEGEAGSGKSLLVDELRMKARRLSIRTFSSSGDVFDQGTPYHGWRPIYKELFGLDAYLDELPKLRSQVLSKLPPISGEKGYPAFAIRLSPLLNDVLPFGFPENRTTKHMSSDLRRKTTHTYLLRLLQRNIAGTSGRNPKPTLLIFDDGHWLDEETWQLIVSVSQLALPTLTVVATQPLCERVTSPRFSRICHMLSDLPPEQMLQIPRLRSNETLKLIHQTLEVDAFPEEAFSIVRRKSGGQPLFTISLAKAWQQTEAIEILNGFCKIVTQLEDLDQTAVPVNVQRIITGRIERMEPSLQLLLKSASVIGEQFTLDELKLTFPDYRDEETLSDQLALLNELGFIEPADSSNAYHFQNDFLREVCHGLLPESLRNEMEIQQRSNEPDPASQPVSFDHQSAD